MRHLFIWFFCLMFGSFVILHATEDPVRFERMPLEEGVSQSIIRSLFQDRSGFMWIGTEDGLNKYDGYTYTVYRYNLDKYDDPYSPTSSNVECIFEDSGGNLWIGTRGGLNKLDLKTGLFVHYRAGTGNEGGLSHNVIRSIAEDDNGQIWIGTEGGGLDRLDPLSGQFRNFQIPGDSRVFSVCKGPRGGIWVGSQRNIVKLDPVTGAVETNHEYLCRAMIKDSSGILWIGSTSGLLSVDPSRDVPGLIPVTPDDGLDSQITCLRMDFQGDLWLGTVEGGLLRYRPETGTFRRFRFDASDQGTISKDRITSLWVDRSGILWIGTYGGGICKMDPRKNRILHYHHQPNNPNSLSHNIVFAISEMPEGVIWLSAYSRGLDRWDRKTGRFTHYRNDPDDPDSLSNDYVSAILPHPDGTLWVGTGGYVDRLDPRTGKFRHYLRGGGGVEGRRGSSTDILLDSDGQLWVCSYGLGLRRLNPEAQENGDIALYRHIPGDPGSISSRFARTLHEDSEGHIWIGTLGGGLNKFDRKTKTFTHFRFDPHDPRSLGHDFVMDVHEDRSGRIWAVTFGGGLNKLDKVTGEFTRYTRKDGLPTNTFYGILEDGDGAFWVSSNVGISRFDPRTGDVRNYNQGDGLQSNEFNGGSFYKSSTGEMFFGGINGFNLFHPDRLTGNPHAPPVVITAFNGMSEKSASSLPASRIRELTLTHRDYVFSFEFAALDYSVPRKNRYAYKMEGLSDHWYEVPASRRYVSFTTLPPGEYVFRVKGSNSDGVWNEEGASVKISILPPFWQTLWFRFLAALMLLGILFMWHRRRMSQLSLKMKTATEMSRVCEKHSLTEREREVLQLMMKGKTNRQIEDVLYISVKTVKNHVYNIYRKFGVGTRLELIHFIQDSVKS